MSIITWNGSEFQAPGLCRIRQLLKNTRGNLKKHHISFLRYDKIFFNLIMPDVSIRCQVQYEHIFKGTYIFIRNINDENHWKMRYFLNFYPLMSSCKVVHLSVCPFTKLVNILRESCQRNFFQPVLTIINEDHHVRSCLLENDWLFSDKFLSWKICYPNDWTAIREHQHRSYPSVWLLFI